MKAMELHRAKVRPRFSSSLLPFFEDLIRKDWSLEQISGRLKHEHCKVIIHETTYQYVYANKKAGGDVHTHLRCRKKSRKRCGSGRNRRGIIPNRTSINEVPSVFDERNRIGDWEGDTIIVSRHKGALVSMVGRISLFTLIEQVKHKTATAVTEAVISCLKPHSDRALTVTVDNGKEFNSHESIAEALDTDVYFTHPYAFWERGNKENKNGLLRQYFSMNRELTDVYQEEV